MIIDVTRKMVDLIEIVDCTAAARERQQVVLHHFVGLFHRNSARLLRLLKDRLRCSDDILVLLDEEIAAGKDRRILFRQFRLILDVDNRNLQKFQACDMRLRQFRILRYNHNPLSVDDRPRQNHSILKIVYGYSTQDKSLPRFTQFLRTNLSRL